MFESRYVLNPYPPYVSDTQQICKYYVMTRPYTAYVAGTPKISKYELTTRACPVYVLDARSYLKILSGVKHMEVTGVSLTHI